MAEGAKAASIIVVKKKGGHGGHHGGAWKVAYADFVTAMMALFIVLWLLSSSEKVKKAVGGYFTDPTGSGKMTGSSMGGAGEVVSLGKDDMDKLKEKLSSALQQLPKFEEIKNQVQMSVTGEGLRIELLETDKGMFFQSGSSDPSENGKELLLSLAKNLGELPNDIVVEGHTDAKPYSVKGNYSNWELSVDRANASRRYMQENGLREGQVAQVRGFADRQLKKPDDPLNPSNRRVSVIVKYVKAQVGAASEEKGDVKEGEGHGEAKGHAEEKPHAEEKKEHH